MTYCIGPPPEGVDVWMLAMNSKLYRYTDDSGSIVWAENPQVGARKVVLLADHERAVAEAVAKERERCAALHRVADAAAALIAYEADGAPDFAEWDKRMEALSVALIQLPLASEGIRS